MNGPYAKGWIRSLSVGLMINSYADRSELERNVVLSFKKTLAYGVSQTFLFTITKHLSSQLKKHSLFNIRSDDHIHIQLPIHEVDSTEEVSSSLCKYICLLHWTSWVKWRHARVNELGKVHHHLCAIRKLIFLFYNILH